MSDEVQQKGWRIPSSYTRPPVEPINPDADFSPESLELLAYINRSETDRSDMEMLFRCGMQFMRYLAKKYGFTIKQWPEK